MPKIVWSDNSDGTPCKVEYWGDTGVRHSNDHEFMQERWMEIKFQAGRVKDVGHNGMCMLDICDAMIKRIRDFQEKWPCEENETIVIRLEQAKETMLLKQSRLQKERRNKCPA